MAAVLLVLAAAVLPMSAATAQQACTTTTTATPTSTSTSSSSTSSTSSSSTTSTTACTTTSTTGGSTTTTAPATSSVATATPSTVKAGGITTLTGQGFAANAALTVTLFSDPVTLGSGTAGPNGGFSITVTIPTTTAQGAHRVVVSGRGASGGSHEAAGDVFVSGTLAVTGSSTTTHFEVGMLAIVIGIWLVALSIPVTRRALLTRGR